MIQDNDIVINVDDFLKEHRQKILEEKKMLKDILNFLDEKQQVNQNVVDSVRSTSENITDATVFCEGNLFSADELYKNDNPRVMVRYGEFSPLNPAFRCSSKPLLGLGEYEERRKIFLEKKKHEYQQYLLNAKNEKEQRNKAKAGTKENESREALKRQSSIKEGMPREIFSPERGLIEETDRCYTLQQQQAYKKELDRQVSEKRKRQKELKDRERAECEKNQQNMMMQQIRLSKSIEEEFQHKVHENHSNKEGDFNENGENSEILLDINGNMEESSFESNKNVTQPSLELKTPLLLENKKNILESPKSSLKSPVIRPGATTCEVDDYEKYQKYQQELYKQELAKQIEEKRKQRRERKQKEIEEEKKIEEKVKEEEEKLRLEYEKEQAERAYRAAQKVQQEVRLQEHLKKIQKETEDRKKTERRSLPTIFSKTIPTNSRFQNKSSFKNVSFAPQTYVYSINESNQFSNDSIPTRKSDSSIIIEAPYTLAIKDGKSDDCCLNQDTVTINEIHERAPSPPLPAVRTRNILKSLPKNEDVFIPSTVSMSKEARDKFLKESKVLSNLTEIRRKLLEKKTDLYNE